VTLPPGWQADIIKGLGGEHSASAEHLLGAWQQWEGGGTANNASFNPLNTTRGDYQKINSVGVSAFPDWKTGIAETVGTLSGYPALSEALRTGVVDFKNPALQADFNKWLTGKATPGMTPYVAKIARSFGQDVPLSETRAATNSAPPPAPVQAKVAAPQTGRVSFMDIALGKKSIMDMFFQKSAPASTPPPASAPAVPPPAGAGQPGWTVGPSGSGWTKLTGAKAGSPTLGGEHGGEHGTSGLPGYSGVDYFAKPGSPAVAPVTGTVVRLSGHDPKLGAVEGAGGPLGWSVYIEGNDGHSYYLTHMGSRVVKPGQKVRQGQPIGTVANYDKYGRASHIHMGVK
jgi:murein DD-endopeptidase MepM/ murein hydrolase activator NlpD